MGRSDEFLNEDVNREETTYWVKIKRVGLVVCFYSIFNGRIFILGG